MICASINRVSNNIRLEGHSAYLEVFKGTEAELEAKFADITANSIGFERGDLRLHCVRDLQGLNLIERSLDVTFRSHERVDVIKRVVRKVADLIDTCKGDLRYGGIHYKSGDIRISFVGNHLEEYRRSDEARYMAEALLNMIEGNEEKIRAQE